MKTLYLLRHAKSSWDDPGLTDRERPLAPRGKKAASRIGRALRTLGAPPDGMLPESRLPDLILCSPARRAVDTLNRVVAELAPDSMVVQPCAALYFKGVAALLALVQGLPAGLSRVMLVGHDPDLAELARSLAGSGAGPGGSAALAALAAKFPTGALAVLDFPGAGWAEVAPGQGILREFVRPRDLS